MTSEVTRASLAEPLLVGRTKLTNRLGFGPVNPGLSEANSARRQALVEFYHQFAQGGIGLVYIGGVAVSPSGRSNRGSLVMPDVQAAELVREVSEQLGPSGTRL